MWTLSANFALFQAETRLRLNEILRAFNQSADTGIPADYGFLRLLWFRGICYFSMEDEASAEIYQILIPTRARMSDDLDSGYRRLRCPLPVLRARKMLKDVDAGKLLDMFNDRHSGTRRFRGVLPGNRAFTRQYRAGRRNFKIRLRKAETG